MSIVANEWLVWGSIAVVVLTIVGTVAVGTARRTPLSSLSAQHVAAAAVVGIIGWEALINLPNVVVAYGLTHAGIDDAPRQAADLAFAAAAAAYVVGAGVAIAAILRRRPWGAALAIGICVGRVITASSAITQVWGLQGQFGDNNPQLPALTATLALGAVPAIVAIFLVVWPFVGRGRGAPIGLA